MHNRKTDLHNRTVNMLTKMGYGRVFRPDLIDNKTFCVLSGPGETLVQWRVEWMFYTEAYDTKGRLLWAEAHHMQLEKTKKFFSKGKGFPHVAGKIENWTRGLYE